MTMAASTGTSPASYLNQLFGSVGGINTQIAAAISQAEDSSSDPRVVSAPNKNGTVDVGLWQINSSHIGESFTDKTGQRQTISSISWLQDPTNNARAAVYLSGGGLNWRPWCTAYGDGACGTRGGGYLAASSPFVANLMGGTNNPVLVNLRKLANVAPGSLGPNAGPTTVATVAAAGGSTVEANDCLAKLPSLLGGGCIWYPSWRRGLLGGLSLGAGALLGLVVAFRIARDLGAAGAAAKAGSPIRWVYNRTQGTVGGDEPTPTLTDQDLEDLNAEMAAKRKASEGETEGERDFRNESRRRRRAEGAA